MRSCWLIAGCWATAVASAAPPVTIWGQPGPQVPPSAHYAVTLRAAGQSLEPFVHETRARLVDKAVDDTGQYLKVPFLGLHSMPVVRTADRKDTYAHSWVPFDADFAAGPVEVEVRLLTPGDGLTMPLQSAAVLPSSLGIVARVEAPGTIRFTLTEPVKVAVVPNAAVAMARSAAAGRALEGYRNPLFIFARAPEQEVPDRDARGTLVVKPGQLPTPAQVAACRVLWFEPGVHELERFNPADPDHYLVIEQGQTVYLAGGAYVFGHFRSPVFRPVASMPRILGRGTLSDARNRWSGIPWKDTPIKNLRAEGIHITDTNNHLTGSPAPMRDVAAVGAWHGNCDGPAIYAPVDDPYTGWHSDDCFVMAADTNLLVSGRARVRNYTVWQLDNAESVWVRPAVDGSRIEGLRVLAQHHWGKGRQVFNCLVSGTAPVRDLLIRDVVLESPCLPTLFRMATSYRGPGQAFQNVRFENLTVRTGGIAAKSPFGGGQPGSIGRVVFQNLVINDVRVTAANCRDYFDLADGVTVGRQIVFD